MSASVRVREDYDRLLRLLPVDIRRAVAPVIHDAEEIKLRFGRPLKIKHGGAWHVVSGVVIEQHHLTDFRSRIPEPRDDHRCGIDGTGHRVSRISSADGRGTDGFNIRVARFYHGLAEGLRPYLHADPSLLIVGLAGTGKSTLLRDVARVIAEKFDANTTIVDTSNEVGGDGRVPHPGIGEADRLFVPIKARQHEVMLEAIANNSAHVVIIDEVQTKLEADTVRHLSPKATFVATTHGADLAELFANAPLSALFHPNPLFRWTVLVRNMGEYEVFETGRALADAREEVPPVPLAVLRAGVKAS